MDKIKVLKEIKEKLLFYKNLKGGWGYKVYDKPAKEGIELIEQLLDKEFEK